MDSWYEQYISELLLLQSSPPSFTQKSNYCCSVAKSCPNSLWPRGLQHVGLPCPSPFPGVCSNSCPLNWWCHPTISFSAAFFSCSHFFLASGSFSMRQLFHQVVKELEFQLQHESFQWIFKTDWFDLLSVQGTLKSPLLQHRRSKASILRCSAFFMVQLSHLYMTTGKTIALTIQTFVGKVVSLPFNMLSRFFIAFLPKSKCLISWLQSPFAVTLEPKICHLFSLFPHLFAMKWWDWIP